MFEIIAIVVGLASAALSARVTLLLARGGDYVEIDSKAPLIVSALKALAFPAQIAIIIAAFLFLQWWIAALVVVGVTLVAGIPVNKSSVVFFYRLSPLLAVVAIFAAIYLWISYLELI